MKRFCLLLILLFTTAPAYGAWDFSSSEIDTDQIRSGGPPKDGIPALFNPAYLSAGEADRVLDSRELVLGFSLGGHSRAYPLRIMSWHELINDTVAGSPVLVSW